MIYVEYENRYQNTGELIEESVRGIIRRAKVENRVIRIIALDYYEFSVLTKHLEDRTPYLSNPHGNLNTSFMYEGVEIRREM